MGHNVYLCVAAPEENAKHVSSSLNSFATSTRRNDGIPQASTWISTHGPSRVIQDDGATDAKLIARFLVEPTGASAGVEACGQAPPWAVGA
eukprot:9370157-Lingulodinium_polyedra.AAC.1